MILGTVADTDIRFDEIVELRNVPEQGTTIVYDDGSSEFSTRAPHEIEALRSRASVVAEANRIEGGIAAFAARTSENVGLIIE